MYLKISKKELLIKPKKKYCKECGEFTYIFSKGKCKSCASLGYTQLQSKSKLKPISPKKPSKPNRTNFFKKHIENIINHNIRCQECGKHLQGTTVNVCHILAKSMHPEVQFEDDNIMYYCNDCHYKFDREISKRNLFKSFPIVLEKFKRLLPKINTKIKSKEFLMLQNQNNDQRRKDKN